MAENLDRLEEFDTNQIFAQICDRLNQWYLQEKPRFTWRSDPLVADLPEAVRKSPSVMMLDAMQYYRPDARYLQESVWLRDASLQARADQFEDVAVAERLFDWTVRNIQLESDDVLRARQSVPHRPFHTLLLGTGMARERAWVFTLLARQQGLDVVLLSTAAPGVAKAEPWLAALVAGDDLYLFDCRLGLPIPGPEGRVVATLAEVAADDALLRKLDLDAAHPYPAKAGDFEHVVAYVEASPFSLSKRMALVELRLTGKRKLALTSPGATLAERLKKIPHVDDARLWQWPFEVALAQAKQTGDEMRPREMWVFATNPDLFKARALTFKGVYDGANGAKRYYLQSRPPESVISEYKLPADVARRYSKEDISKVEAANIVTLRRVRQDASYWLGLVVFQQQDYPTALFFFSKGTLGESPGGPWTAGAHYNLGRTYEAMGELAKAIAEYEADTSSPQSDGSRLCARLLKEKELPEATAEAAR